MARSLLSLGSNLGDRAGTLAAAREQLAAHEEITILRATSILENPAILFHEQPDFLNQVLEIETSLEPEELLRFLLDLERRLGRQRRFPNGPREIDLDILTYDDLSLKSHTLTLPHPGIYDREYLHHLLAELGITYVSDRGGAD